MAPTQHVARGPPASGTASDSANAVPTAGSTAAAVLRYITAALPEPASYSHRKRSAGESGWEAHIKVLSGGSGRISASSLQNKDISGRVARLYADIMMQLLAVTVADPDAVVGRIAERLLKTQGKHSKQRANNLHTNVLTRVVKSVNRMLSHTGLPGEARSTIAAVASAVPQPVFTALAVGKNMGKRSSNVQLKNRNGVVRNNQGGLRPRAQRVGLGERARLTARANRARLEEGLNVSERRATRFNPQVVERAVSWLASAADISSNWKRKVTHAGKRVDVPSMLLRQRPSNLYSQYIAQVDDVIGQRVFRSIIDRAFTVTRGRRAAMDYLGLTLGERNFTAVRKFVEHVADAATKQQVLALITSTSNGCMWWRGLAVTVRVCFATGVASFLAVDFSTMVQVTSSGNTRFCVAHHADLALLPRGDDGGVVCAHCAVVDELCDTLKALARTDDDEKDVEKMCSYMHLYQAHQLRGKLQAERCRQLRAALAADTCYIILDFKMKWLPVWMGGRPVLDHVLLTSHLLQRAEQMAFREASGEWFGKKGICWHGAVVTLPAHDGAPQQHITVHDILYSETKQDAITVLSIVESLLVFVRRRWPHIQRAILQTDNAACYCSNMMIGA